MRALRQADEVLVRTGGPVCVRTLEEGGIPYISLDGLYARCRNYDTLAKKIAAEIRRRAKGRKVAYCVDGSVAEDAAARLLHADAVFEGVGKGAHYACRAGFYGGYSAVSAFWLEERPLALPLVVYDITKDNAGDVKLCLAERFGDEAPAVVFTEDGERHVPLYELDRLPAVAVALAEIPLLEKKRFSFGDFVAVLKRLRAPDGCPWDKVQTHESIRINAIEEAYELVDAIDRKDPERMCEETGDVLMQAVFHALIEEEKGGFTVGDMVTGVCEKLITRHTHIFGKDKASDADGALSVWDKNKMKEKGQTTYSDAVNDVPACFPALLRAQKIAKRMEKGGWDAAGVEDFESKFREEYAEFREALASQDRARIAEELGDVLFCTVELGRASGTDCEMALLDTVKKMQARYTAFETLVRADGKEPNALSEEERCAYYQRAKDDTRA